MNLAENVKCKGPRGGPLLTGAGGTEARAPGWVKVVEGSCASTTKIGSRRRASPSLPSCACWRVQTVGFLPLPHSRREPRTPFACAVPSPSRAAAVPTLCPLLCTDCPKVSAARPSGVPMMGIRPRRGTHLPEELVPQNVSWWPTCPEPRVVTRKAPGVVLQAWQHVVRFLVARAALEAVSVEWQLGSPFSNCLSSCLLSVLKGLCSPPGFQPRTWA